MFKKNKFTNKKENHNEININSTHDNTNIFIKIYEELKNINASLIKQNMLLENHETRLTKLENKRNGGGGK